MSNYFNRLPDFDYVSRLPDAKISDYIRVKNLFKKGKLREDIFQDLTFFTKYEIVGNDRPDNVAFKEYNDSNLDWVVLQSNNIINIQTEWPLSQRDFDRYNSVYTEYFTENQPCRTTVEVVSLPTPIAIELKCIATID